MTTGYTAIIEEKPETTFAEFAMRCARGIGYLFRMRDQGLDAPIPDKLVPDGYYEQEVTRAKHRLAEVSEMSIDDAERMAAKTYAGAVAQSEIAVRRQAEKMALYEAMRVKVEAWQPPTAKHVTLKNFMLEQLETGKPHVYTMPEHERLTGAAFKAQEVDDARSALERAEKRWADECRRADEANDWLRALRESLC